MTSWPSLSHKNVIKKIIPLMTSHIIIFIIVLLSQCFCIIMSLILCTYRYEESKERNTKGYEERFLTYLEDIINQLDKRIERGYARLKRSASAKAEVLI